jgi:hypothetical protein
MVADETPTRSGPGCGELACFGLSSGPSKEAVLRVLVEDAGEPLITLDRSRTTAAWRVDGRTVYKTHGTFIPERVRIGFGIWTMLPIRDGRSLSIDGHGMTARWPRFRVRGVDA